MFFWARVVYEQKSILTYVRSKVRNMSVSFRYALSAHFNLHRCINSPKEVLKHELSSSAHMHTMYMPACPAAL